MTAPLVAPSVSCQTAIRTPVLAPWLPGCPTLSDRTQCLDHRQDSSPARVVSALVGRLDRGEERGLRLEDLPAETLPATIGRLIRNNRVTTTPCSIPLAQLHNTYISGTTGSGKTYLGRVIVEEATKYEELNILILDPRNQAAGLLVPEDRASILSLYPELGIPPDGARGFQFRYYAPAETFGEEIPRDLSEVAAGRSIVSFKGLDDRERCELFARILDAVFDSHAREESPTLRTILVIEEAQRFTKKRVSDAAKAAGEKAERALDRTAREGRKYGQGLFILSQTIRDFAYDSASIRQNTNTKIFLHNSDREIDYAADFIGDGREIVKLPTGTAIVYNAAWGTARVKVRPPLSKVWEFSPSDTRRIVEDAASRPVVKISEAAEELLSAVLSHHEETGQGLNLSRAGERLRITSKRKLQQVVDELERSGFVRTRKLRERGQPRVIEPLSSTVADRMADRT